MLAEHRVLGATLLQLLQESHFVLKLPRGTFFFFLLGETSKYFCCCGGNSLQMNVSRRHCSTSFKCNILQPEFVGNSASTS